MLKIKYAILLFFVGIQIFSQNNIDISESYKLKYDSAFSKSFGKSFFKKNIKYSTNKYFLKIDTLDIDNEDNSNTENFFINKKNISVLSKFYNDKDRYFSSYGFYTYNFLYNGYSFYQSIYRFDFINNKEQFNFENQQILEYYKKIQNKEYINPKKVSKIVKSKMLKNICSQSLVNNNTNTIWEIKDCSDNSTIKILELDSKSGKELRLYQRDYYPWEKAAYWNEISGEKKQIFIPSKQY